ncbi:MAG TPA: diguanylate cyclase [Clostridiales bacterium]|nr:diguanylate cyclase [Clostridiales bacterium]
MNLRSKYRLITSIVTIAICIIVLSLTLLSHKQIFEVYEEQISDIAIHQKKNFLKDTVNNIFLEIDNIRELKETIYEGYIQSRLKRFNQEMHRSDDDFAAYFINRFTEDFALEMWTVLLWNDKTNQILYSTSGPNKNPAISQATIVSQVDAMKKKLFSYEEIKKGNLRGIFGISTEYLNNSAKEEAADLIRNLKFSNESYIWINEIINYEGGDNYAVCRVHPKLSETEGDYLSTNTKDINGELPYLEELDGVKKDGELFYSYYFKKSDSDKISEKITYAKLYKDYDWIVAMGVHLDNIDLYIAEAQDQFKDVARAQMFKMLLFIMLVLIAGFVILSIMERKNLTRTTSHLEETINLDTLTKAGSRRYGENKLQILFDHYKATGDNLALILFDVDNFKSINDKYGHAVGDKFLIQIVSKIKTLIRSSDRIVRWGGDEFLGIFPGMKNEYVLEFSQDLSTNIGEIEISTEKGNVQTTVSAGIAYFEAADSSWEEALKRADEALYKAKDKGKNQISYL